MNDTRLTRDEHRPTHIPLIGRLTLPELLGFVALSIGIAFGSTGMLALYPFIEIIMQPGSGGSAQMLVAMFVFPGLYFFGMLLLGCIAGFVSLFRSSRQRIRKKYPAQDQNVST